MGNPSLGTPTLVTSWWQTLQGKPVHTPSQLLGIRQLLHYNKTSDLKHLREEGVYLAIHPITDAGKPWQQLTALLCSQEAERERWTLVLSTTLSFYSVWDPSSGWHSHLEWVSIPQLTWSGYSVLDVLANLTQSRKSLKDVPFLLGIVEPVWLTVDINCHR